MHLWETLVQRQAHALTCGAMHPIPTEFAFVEDAGVRFVVRIVSNLVRKAVAKREQEQLSAATGKKIDPFLPHEEDLFVTDVSETHIGLLNKYNVLDHHLLIVTREYEEQTAPLTLRDFEAMWLCMAEFDGLAFYNAGEIAGASQPHKHLQMVPLPLAPGMEGVPIEPLIRRGNLPFRSAIAPVDDRWSHSASEAARATLDRYLEMLERLGVGGEPYNLLVAREWMLLVPRSRHRFETISVNSLGFAGALLVRDSGEMETVERHGPMKLLRHVACGQLPR